MTNNTVILFETSSGERFEINRAACTLGRSKDADIFLEDRLASRQHALIVNIRGRYFIEDLESTNGTMVNDRVLKGRQEICVGDEIRIGCRRFVMVSIAVTPEKDTVDLTVTQKGTEQNPLYCKVAV